MTYKDKLISLLKEVPKIKEDLEDLKFGTEVELVGYFGEKKINQLVDINCLEFFVCGIHERFYRYNIKKINGNELQEKHLRIYCDLQDIDITIKMNGHIVDYSNAFCKIDNSKSFNNQTEEFYEKLYNYLINLN